MTEKAEQESFIREPSEEQWERHWQLGYAPIRMAALLSLNVLPNTKNKDSTFKGNADFFKEYCRRRNLILVNYGKHSDLPKVKDPGLAGEKYGAIVNLERLCKFLLERKIFTGDEPMLRAFNSMAKPAARPKEDSTPNAETSAVDPVVIDFYAAPFTTQDETLPNETILISNTKELPKGERYRRDTLGAILIILEGVLKESRRNTTDYLVGDHINPEALGRAIHQLIKGHKNAGKEGINNLTEATRANHIREAQKLFK